MIVEFFVPGEPHGKGRPRMTRTGHAYTDSRTRAYEKAVGALAFEAMSGRKPIEVGCTVELEAFFLPAKSLSAKRRLALLGTPVLKKPDADNVAKAVIDGMNGIVFRDDSLVWSVKTTKIYGEVEGVTVRVQEGE